MTSISTHGGKLRKKKQNNIYINKETLNLENNNDLQQVLT